MTESVNLNTLIYMLKANFLINALSIFCEMKVKKKNLKNLLYLAYGLNSFQAELLIKASKGIINDVSFKVIDKAEKELIKFLNIYKEYFYLKVKILFFINTE